MSMVPIELIIVSETDADLSVGRFEIPEGCEEDLAEALTEFMEDYLKDLEDKGEF